MPRHGGSASPSAGRTSILHDARASATHHDAPGLAATYARDGFALVSGLVPPDVLECARAELWDFMSGVAVCRGEDFCATASRPSPLQSDRHTWPQQWNGIVDGPATVALFTPACLSTATALADAAANTCPFPVADHRITAPRQGTLALTKFPASLPAPDAPSQWQPHFDSFVREGVSGWRTSPKPMRTQMICFLTGTSAAGEGGTVCWPCSHRRMEGIYAGDPHRFASLEALRQDMMAEACHGIRPVAVWPMAGDVLFFDLLTGHSTNSNVSGEPRLAVKHSFAVPFQQQAHLLTGVRNIT
jgi:hypothetical protein